MNKRKAKKAAKKAYYAEIKKRIAEIEERPELLVRYYTLEEIMATIEIEEK